MWMLGCWCTIRSWRKLNHRKLYGILLWSHKYAWMLESKFQMMRKGLRLGWSFLQSRWMICHNLGDTRLQPKYLIKKCEDNSTLSFVRHHNWNQMIIKNVKITVFIPLTFLVSMILSLQGFQRTTGGLRKSLIIMVRPRHKHPNRRMKQRKEVGC